MGESRVIVVATESGAGTCVESVAAALGYHALPVQTVNEAVAVVEREGNRVAAIFSGIALKDGNWCDLIERLQLLGCEAPVVLCANDGSAETWWDALEHGVWEVVAPPVAQDVERIIAACEAPKGTDRI